MSNNDVVNTRGDGMDVASWAVILVLVVSPFLVIGCIVCMIICCDCNHYGEMVLPKKAPWFRKRLIKLSLVTKKVHDHPKLHRHQLCKSQPIVLRRVRPPQDNFTVVTELELESQYNHSQCVICLETYNIGDSISWARKTMYCNHAFHTHCIQKWLKNKRSCPCCRYEILRWDDMHIRVNAWSDYCCGRRSRIRNDRMQRNLLHQCREMGEYCVEHGLVFPFVQPVLEDPYEPRISELEECLTHARDHLARRTMRRSVDHQEESAGNSAIPEESTTTDMTTLEGSAPEEMELGQRHPEIPLRTLSVLNRQRAEVPGRTNNARSHVIVFTASNERDSSNHTTTEDRRSLHLQGVLGTHAFPIRMSTARSYE